MVAWWADEAKRLRAEGLTYRQVAERVDRSPLAVRKALGLQRPKKWMPEDESPTFIWKDDWLAGA